MYTQTSVFPRDFTQSSIKYFPSSKLNKPTGWEPQSCDVTGYIRLQLQITVSNLTKTRPEPNQGSIFSVCSRFTSDFL